MLNLAAEFDKNWQDESKRHAAVTIRNEVSDWSGSYSPTAKKRWLWEILQNAIDTANENRVSHLEIEIESENGNLAIKHNGGGFLLKELIALVSGGTSKYFGRETLGRFGKGFLVTHIVSKEVIVEGLITHKETIKKFRIKLNRNGDEKQIEQNINDCKEMLDGNLPPTETGEQNETLFTYLNADPSLMNSCKSFSYSIPYIMAFNPILKQVQINLNNQEKFSKSWFRRGTEACEYNGRKIEKIVIDTSEGQITVIKVRGAKLEAAVLLDNSSGLRIVDTRYLPSFYCNLPLCDSDNVGLSFAINSNNFGIDTNRCFINSSKETCAVNSEIFQELPFLLDQLLDYLISINVPNLHLLCHIEISKLPQEKSSYLLAQFYPVAEKLSCKPIVYCKGNKTSPLSSTIPSSEYLGQNVSQLTPLMYNLLSTIRSNVPDYYDEWAIIAKEWASVGVGLTTYCLEDLLNALSQDLQFIKPENQKKYIESLIAALYSAQLITQSIPKEITKKKILLNQKQELIAPEAANIDLQTDSALKDIAIKAGWDIKRQLLDDGVFTSVQLQYFVANSLCSGRERFTNDLILKTVWDSYISTKWKQNQKNPEYKAALLLLLIWLTRNKTPEEIKTAINPSLLPVLCSDGQFRCNQEMLYYPFLHPIDAIDKELLPFISVINSRWIMDSEYITQLSAEEKSKFLEKIVTLGIAYNSPIIRWSDKQISEKEAAAIAVDGSFPTGVKISCSDIIGLQDATSGVAGSKDLALASQFLNFILKYVIAKDASWSTSVYVNEKKLFACYWLAILKTKDWVPSADGKHLETLTRDSWERLLAIPSLELTDQIVNFLGSHFGINLSGILALKLKNMNPFDSRTVVIDKLLTAEPTVAAKIAEEVEKHLENVRVVEHNQRIGHIIEKIALEIFQNQGFRTEWTGVGSDFKLINQEDELGSLKIFPLSFDQNSEILIEVKATATGIAKLTMTQAQTALNYRQRYIICVLDLSSFDNTILLDDLTPTVVQTVKDSMTFVGNIANTIEEAFQKASALQLNQNIIKEVEVPPGVKITFEDSDIRIGVLKKVWAQGQLFAEIAQYCSAIFSN